MKEQKSLKKGEIASSSSERGRSEETMSQIWIKKRRDEYNDASTMEKSKRREVEILLINNDVLEELMLRLPVKSLVRFQVVSKHWMRTIKSSSFKDKHLLHEKTLEPKILLLYNYEDGNNITLKTLSLKWSCLTSTCLVEEAPVHRIEPQNKESNKAFSSCDGLLCIFDFEIFTAPILVTNPATGQSQFLPPSLIQQQCIDKKKPLLLGEFLIPGFGKDSVTGTYKLVLLHNPKSNNNMSSSYEVFDFDVKKWRYMTMDTPYELFSINGPIFAKGWFYWVNRNQTILAYNLHTEMFTVITHRILSQATWAGFIHMCNLNDHLWITDTKGDNNGIQDFWRIKNVLELDWEWEKMFSIDSTLLSPWFPKKYYPLSNSSLKLMATSKDNKKVLVSKISSSKLVQLLIHPTSLAFLSIFCGPICHCDFIPYFQSLDFPL